VKGKREWSKVRQGEVGGWLVSGVSLSGPTQLVSLPDVGSLPTISLPGEKILYTVWRATLA